MGTTKHNFHPGSHERLSMFNGYTLAFEDDDHEAFVDEVDISPSHMEPGTFLTIKQQPSCPHSLTFCSFAAKAYSAVLRIKGWDAFGMPFTEDVTHVGSGAAGSELSPYFPTQSRTPCAWIDSIQLISYVEGGAGTAGIISVGRIVAGGPGTQPNLVGRTGTVWSEHDGCAIQVQPGCSKEDVRIITQILADPESGSPTEGQGVLHTIPKATAVVEQATGRYALPDSGSYDIAGVAQVLTVFHRPDLYVKRV